MIDFFDTATQPRMSGRQIIQKIFIFLDEELLNNYDMSTKIPV